MGYALIFLMILVLHVNFFHFGSAKTEDSHNQTSSTGIAVSGKTNNTQEFLLTALSSTVSPATLFGSTKRPPRPTLQSRRKKLSKSSTTTKTPTELLRPSRQMVVDTVEVQDEIVGPSEARIPVASSSSSQISPLTPPPQVSDTVQVQDSVIGPTGIQTPVASSTQTRFSRQFGPSQPQVVDTVDVQDEIVGPNGARIPIASSSSSQISPLVSPPQMSDTVQVQDSVIGPTGIQTPVASSSQTRFSRQFGLPHPQIVDTVEVQDEIVGPNGARIPIASSFNSQISPLASPISQFVPQSQVVDTVEVQDTIVNPATGVAVPIGSTSNIQVSSLVPAALVPQPQVLDTIEVQDTIVDPVSGAVAPIGSVAQTVVSPVIAPPVVLAATVFQPPAALGSSFFPLQQPQVFDTETVEDTIVGPTGIIPMASAFQSRALPVSGSYRYPQPVFYKREFSSLFNNESAARHPSVVENLKAVPQFRSEFELPRIFTPSPSLSNRPRVANPLVIINSAKPSKDATILTSELRSGLGFQELTFGKIAAPIPTTLPATTSRPVISSTATTAEVTRNKPLASVEVTTITSSTVRRESAPPFKIAFNPVFVQARLPKVLVENAEIHLTSRENSDIYAIIEQKSLLKNSTTHPNESPTATAATTSNPIITTTVSEGNLGKDRKPRFNRALGSAKPEHDDEIPVTKEDLDFAEEQSLLNPNPRNFMQQNETTTLGSVKFQPREMLD